MPVVCPVDDEGRFTAEVPDYAGQFVKDADKPIIMQRLKDRAQARPPRHDHAQLPALLALQEPAHLPRHLRLVRERREDQDAHARRQRRRSTGCPRTCKDGRFGKWLEDARDWAISPQPLLGQPHPGLALRRLRGRRSASAPARSWRRSPGVKVDGPAQALRRRHHLAVLLRRHHAAHPRGARLLVRVRRHALRARTTTRSRTRSTSRRTSPRISSAEGLDQTRGWFYTLVVLGGGALRQAGLPQRHRERPDPRRRRQEDVASSQRNYTDPMRGHRRPTAPTPAPVPDGLRRC